MTKSTCYSSVDMGVRRWVLCVLWSVGVVAGTGCGGGGATTSTTSSRVVNGNLNGNWLITGSLPSLPALTTNVNLAMTFNIIGSNVVAAGFMNVPCGNGTYTDQFGTIASGTIASDGSFTVQFPSTVAPQLMSVAIQGNVPKASEEAWTGTYTVGLNGTGCTGTFSGPFSATPIQPVTGTYVGNRTFTVLGINWVSTTVPVTVQMSLQQGAITAGQPGFYNSAALTGSIQVQGLSCFSTGTISSTSLSGVEGNEIVAIFDMNDGSTVELLGALEDVGATRLSTTGMFVHGGNCGLMTSVGNVEFDRQP